jgi:hypothetical protein
MFLKKKSFSVSYNTLVKCRCDVCLICCVGKWVLLMINQETNTCAVLHRGLLA